ncbi:MAG: hypothetical protein M3405_03405 [Acidobacteriota bacterium]|nr:hypothetical protein [Acidobacteriota bacterium]
MIELESALKALTENEVEFVIIGEIATYFYGCETITLKLEIYYSRTNDNLIRIVKALKPFNPLLRGFPENLPFIWDDRTLQNGTNFTLDTDLGSIDLLGEVSGVGNYSDVETSSVKMKICDVDVKVISLNDLINAKRAAGRTKDLLVLPELEALQESFSDEDE